MTAAARLFVIPTVDQLPPAITHIGCYIDWHRQSNRRAEQYCDCLVSTLLTDIAPGDRRGLEATLRMYQVPLTEEVSTVRRWSMACVAWPTCGLSITEAERALPGIIDQMEVELSKLGLSREKFTVRMTGCPNGCARP